MSIPSLRLHNQHITQSKYKKIEDLVFHMGAIQAQDYLGSLWSIGSRLNNVSEKDIEDSIRKGNIIRTWPMRGTIHFVSNKDIRWMVELMAPRVVLNARKRSEALGLTDKVINKARKVIESELKDGKPKTREHLLLVLNKSGINTKEQRGYHILWRLSQECLICMGPRMNKKHTFVLLTKWAPNAKSLSREDSLKEITYRYFNSHGPATIQDFVWWTGLKVSEAKEGIEMNKLMKMEYNGKTFYLTNIPKRIENTSSLKLLSTFEEYIVGYRNRDEILSPKYSNKINPGQNGMFSSIIVSNGQIIGTWKRVIKKNKVHISKDVFRPLTKTEKEEFNKEAIRYAKFLGLEAQY